jgi:hypothetical protein
VRAIETVVSAGHYDYDAERWLYAAQRQYYRAGGTERQVACFFIAARCQIDATEASHPRRES